MKLFPSHRRQAPFYWGLAAAAATSIAALQLLGHLAVGLAANAFFLVFLVLTAARLPRLSAAHLRENASEEDEPVAIIFLVAFAAVAVSVGSLFMLLGAAGQPDGLDLTLALSSVALGWLTIHTMASLHYAHLYWRPERSGGDRLEKAGGLDFPGSGEPNGYDFLYFGFVLGMTAQTSDTAVTTTAMRKATLVHSLVAFLFNTVLVAAAVNVAVSLGA